MNKINPSKIMLQEIKPVKKIFSVLGRNNVFFVGGVVRNFLLNEPLEDIDLAVKLNSEEVKKKLSKNKIKFLDLSKGHGTVTIISKSNVIEITSMRIDKETYGRKAKVEFVSDIFLDSCRRDFTINSIYLNYDGEFYDPHNGRKDLKNKVIKFIGNPKERIQEDKLRVLRYFRFLSYYGCKKNNIHKGSMLACLESLSCISSISKERTSYEFFKLMKGKYVVDVLILMKTKKVLKLIIPGIDKIKNSYLKDLGKSKEDKILRISFLLITARANLEKVRESLFLNKKEFHSIRLLLKSYKLYEINNIKEARLVKYKLGAEASLNLYYLKCLINKKNIRKQIEKTLESWSPPDFPMDGNDLKKIGIKKGHLLGKVLQKTRAWWIEKDFQPSRKKCLDKSKLVIFNSREL